MRVLVACEYSGKVREAFRKLGHDAWSCDLLPADDGSPYHIQGDVIDHLADGWDLMIAHPPCTYLANSGVSWLYKKDEPGVLKRHPTRWGNMTDGAHFFRRLLLAPIPHICVENPVMHGHAQAIIGIKPTQVIQPWMFGHTEQKATCFWLKNLPPLHETKNVHHAMMQLSEKERQRLHFLPPSEDRWKLRSETFQGIADAMAEQWGTKKLMVQETLL
jgi:hypothetical protein